MLSVFGVVKNSGEKNSFGENLVEDKRVTENSSKANKAGRLPMFLDKAREPDLSKITVEDFLCFFNRKNFNQYFDREKILAFLRKKAQVFETEILGKVSCPYCKSTEVIKVVDKNGFSDGYYRCRCRKKFKVKSFINTRFTYGTCALVLADFAQGKRPREVFQLLVTENTNHYLDYGVKEKIPDEKTLYDISEKCAKKFEKFNDLMMLLIGGIPCKTLFCDDAFAPKHRQKRRYAIKKKKRRRKRKRFYYAILTMDADSRFIVCLFIASFRDKRAFLYAFAKTDERLKGHLEVIKGDKLKAMEKAAEVFFPKNVVRHIFKKLKKYEKGDLMIIERKIRSLRKTIRKRQRFGSLNVLRNLAVLALIELNYLDPMEKALGGKSPAQAVGIPYPFYPYNWRKFMIWVNWVFNNLSEILKSGLKQLPGCPLKPCTEANGQLLKERLKLKKKKVHH